MSAAVTKWLDIAPGLVGCMYEAYGFARPDAPILPRMVSTFRAFRYFPPSKTRVVILGQDPYHSVDMAGNPKAWGLAFGYNPSYSGPTNSSLANIINEIDVENPEKFDRSLEGWAKQGVLLLNTCLTVKLDRPLSHRDMGWQEQVEIVLKYLLENTDIIYVLWGAEARKLGDRIGVPDYRRIDTSHPSRYSAHAGPRPFRGSKCFDEANSMLRARGHRPINWEG